MAAQQVTKKTVITPAQQGRRFHYEASANGRTVSFRTSAPVTITAEPINVNGRIGVVFRDARGEPIRYSLRDA